MNGWALPTPQNMAGIFQPPELTQPPNFTLPPTINREILAASEHPEPLPLRPNLRPFTAVRSIKQKIPLNQGPKIDHLRPLLKPPTH